jgi:hypothetical protein
VFPIDKDDHETLLVTTIILVTERGGLHHPSEEVEENLAIMRINETGLAVPMSAAVAHHRMTVDGTGNGLTQCPDKVSDYNAFCSNFFTSLVIILG